MSKIIFRNDDVSYNTDLTELYLVYDYLRSQQKNCEIWSCVTLFSQKALNGAVYPEVPFKDKNIDWFYKNAGEFIGSKLYRMPYSKICSHGLYHVDHTKISYDAQKMSILGSCWFLKTKIFVPPFNRWNEDTEKICNASNILLAKFTDGWRSLEHEQFTPNHKNWYFHSWRFGVEKLKEALCQKQLVQ